jgi:integrase
MGRSRPATDPISHHKPTGQYYVTRGGKRIYLGADPDEALKEYHRLSLREPQPERPPPAPPLSAKDLANRFVAAQQANWRNPNVTLRCYREWLGRFLKDHPRLQAGSFTAEAFASWKLTLRARGYAAETINHFLNSVRAMFAFAEQTGLIEKAPPLRRVKNERRPIPGGPDKPLYAPGQVQSLLQGADRQMHAMILLALNCGFGPKDLRDLNWSHFDGDRVTLPRSKTGICQTFLLWPDTIHALEQVRQERAQKAAKAARRGKVRSDSGYAFITYFWQPWNKDAVGEQFRKLCKKVGVPCYGFYRLRHCASTAMSLVATPHVHRKFMRHAQLQQQVTYTHTPDEEVDTAVMRAREKLLPGVGEGQKVSEDEGSDPQQAGAA